MLSNAIKDTSSGGVLINCLSVSLAFLFYWPSKKSQRADLYLTVQLPVTCLNNCWALHEGLHTITHWVKGFLLWGSSEFPHQMAGRPSLWPAELHCLVCCHIVSRAKLPRNALHPHYSYFLRGGFIGLFGKIVLRWSSNITLCLQTNSHPAAADQHSWDGGDWNLALRET